MSVLAFLLHPAYELAGDPGKEIADGAQLVDGEWWHPQFGCDSLQRVVDNAREALVPDFAVPRERYHEDDGPGLWWRVPVMDGKQPWVGTPNDSDWPGYHTHFTPLPPAPVAPTPSLNEAP
jgi:hypothetical protein